ncbi:Toxin HigB-2 (modular protein) [Rhodospirillaceae bacterium LM-1]|nr:Toxin HigB-2 (modular protein) [Rhodospirillaceae bacterium LM-1]
MLTLVEFPTFAREADELLTRKELDELRTLLTTRPEAGVVIPGTGGIRKLRFGVEAKGKGKRGGARVIYYFHSPVMPLALLAIYAKNEKIDLSANDKRELKMLVADFVATCARSPTHKEQKCVRTKSSKACARPSPGPRARTSKRVRSR